MAEKPDAKGSKTKKEKKGPGMGHNININEMRKRAEPAFAEILAKFKDMEEDAGSYRSDIKNLYEKHAGEIGIPAKLLREEVAKLRQAQKREAKEMELAADDREAVETLRQALKGTPFGNYLDEKLPKPPKAAAKD